MNAEEVKTGQKEVSEADKKLRQENRQQELAKLQCPSNFPKEIVIYFGSQTGNAEKMAH